MWKVTRKGLAAQQDALRAHRDRGHHRRRVHVGHARCSPRRSRRRSTTCSPNIYKNTDAVVRAPEVLSSDFGSGRAAERPGVAPRRGAAARRASPRPKATCRIAYAQVVDKNGKADRQSGTGPADVRASGGTPNSQLNQFHIVEGAGAGDATTRSSIDKNTADKGEPEGRRPRHGAHHEARRRSTRSSASRSSAPPTASPARRRRCSRCRRRSASRTPSTSSARSRWWPSPACRRRSCRTNITKTLDGQRAEDSTR